MAAIYGPRMKGNYPRLVKALSRGIFIPVGKGDNRRTLVHEEDAVRAAVLAAQHPRAAGRVYNVSDGQNPFAARHHRNHLRHGRTAPAPVLSAHSTDPLGSESR